MKSRLLIALVAAAAPHAARALQPSSRGDTVETAVHVPGATLYARVAGRGRAVIVLHGGPDFDHAYLLPDLDRLADAFRLIYYDQRGRGLSARGVRPDEVSMASEVDDLDRVREYFHLDSTVLLGHSWGAVLALEYAVRNPTRVSRLILMNPAPVSAADYATMRAAYLRKQGAAMQRQSAIIAGVAYRQGDPDTVLARYRIHFAPAFARTEAYERLMTVMGEGFARQGPTGILEARAVEARLHSETWQSPGYDLLPTLRDLAIPTLVIAGDHDFIPIEVAEHIVSALPNARLVVLHGCGHFSYLECPPDVRRALTDFFGAAK